MKERENGGRRCPHCNEVLTNAQIVDLMHGDGYIRHVRVQLKDGRIVSMRAGEINPHTMTVLD